ncbi:MAG: DUF3105 domain-containing protein [Actinobacteria bacterium]|nr:DUF3105 domain-containing protein [Actinomycetota bacterium]
MAKKSRTPRPPVQAPRRRDVPGGHGMPALPGGPWLLAGIGAAVVVVIVVVVALAGGGGKTSSADVRAAMLAAGCTYYDRKPLPPHNKTNYHADVPSLSTPMDKLWDTFPPAAGAHYGLWAVWGFYTDPVNPRQVVHNEEHGAVVMWWGKQVPQSEITQLQNFYDEQPVGVFGTPLYQPIAGKTLGSRIALTAWTGNPSDYYRNGDYGIGHVAICPRFNQKAFETFRNAYRGHGPEGIPLSFDKPGLGPG